MKEELLLMAAVITHASINRNGSFDAPWVAEASHALLTELKKVEEENERGTTTGSTS